MGDETDEHGLPRVISYASRSLSDSEKNYTPFLLEMQPACWGMDHFDIYLKGQKFILFTDHKPFDYYCKIIQAVYGFVSFHFKV